MKTIIILGSRDFGEKNDTSELVEQLSKQNIRFKNYFFEDLVFYISNQSRKIINMTDGQELKSADLVIAFGWYKPQLKDIAYTTALYLEENQVVFWNSEMSKQRSSTKLSTLWLVARAGVAISDTIFSLNTKALIDNWSGNSSIVKDIAASRGRSNYLIKSKPELENILQKSSGRYLLQNFEPNDYDIRLICFAGEPQLAIKRERKDNSTHLNNTSKEGQASLLALDNIPEFVLTQAKEICQLMGREMAGIDFLVANSEPNRYICLEVNAVPQLTSGSFTAEKYSQLTEIIERI